MANPSLQIGNSNWAIKEDNLLGYSTAGTRFLPQPITMTRASAGTRVNPQGLIETVELLGSEEIVCGDFECAVPTDVWDLSTGWTISSGKARANLVQNQNMFQAKVYTSGKTYKVTYTISDYDNGTVRFQFGGGGGTDQGEINSSNGVYTEYITATANHTSSRFRGQLTDGGFTGNIDNVSVKESTKNNLARVDYDGTASSLLVEPERTNLVTYSEDFSNAYWLKVGTTVVSGQTSPSYDSPTGAFKLVEGTTSAEQGIRFTSSITSVVSSFSVMAKYNGRYFRVSGNINVQDYVNFNLQNGTITRNGGGITNAKIEHIVDGWYRCTGTYTGGNMNIGVTNDANATYLTNYTGDGVSGVYIFGSQFEAGSYPTSYIPTSGSSVTRVKDQYEKTGISNLINSEEGVLFAELSALSDDGTDRQICLRDDTWTNRMFLRLDASSNQITFRYYIGGSLTVNLLNTLTDITIINKIACKWELNKFKLYVNGNKVAEDLSANVMGADLMNRIAFDDGLGTNVFYGKVKQLQIFKTALTDPELATLTT